MSVASGISENRKPIADEPERDRVEALRVPFTHQAARQPEPAGDPAKIAMARTR
jgi:hypothetical protein